jgi:hypothetical protein
VYTINQSPQRKRKNPPIFSTSSRLPNSFSEGSLKDEEGVSLERQVHSDFPSAKGVSRNFCRIFLTPKRRTSLFNYASTKKSTAAHVIDAIINGKSEEKGVKNGGAKRKKSKKKNLYLRLRKARLDKDAPYSRPNQQLALLPEPAQGARAGSTRHVYFVVVVVVVVIFFFFFSL